MVVNMKGSRIQLLYLCVNSHMVYCKIPVWCPSYYVFTELNFRGKGTVVPVHVMKT